MPTAETSLSEAREKHRAAHKLVKDGYDPSAHRQEKRRQQLLNAENTFEAMARAWIEHNRDVWSENHTRTVTRRLEQDVFPAIGKRPVQDITPPVLLEVIRNIENRSAFEVARRALQMSSQVFRYAIQNGKGEHDPSISLKGALKPYQKSHYAAIEAKDIPDFLAALNRNEARLFPTTRLAVEILMLTFVRTSELIKAKWEEFDLKEGVWIIPSERMKMRKEHNFPSFFDPFGYACIRSTLYGGIYAIRFSILS